MISAQSRAADWLLRLYASRSTEWTRHVSDFAQEK
jgi:hypothetical protein